MGGGGGYQWGSSFQDPRETGPTKYYYGVCSKIRGQPVKTGTASNQSEGKEQHYAGNMEKKKQYPTRTIRVTCKMAHGGLRVLLSDRTKGYVASLPHA